MKTGKKLLSVLLSLLLVLGAVAVGGINAAADGSIVWNAAENRYEISDYAGLKKFADIVNGVNNPDGLENPQAACATLTQDITADDAAWTPIGNVSNNYIGKFDGDGNIITGLSTPADYNSNYVGLFGYVGSKTEGGVTTKGTVKNVGLVGGTITGKQYVGGVAGYNNGGTVTNCYNTGSVTATEINARVGGVTGLLNGGSLTGCYNTGNVSGNYIVGGVVGESFNNSSVENCYNTGNVSGPDFVGGVVGDNYNNSSVENCYNTGSVTAIGQFADAGGVVGYNYLSSTISNCYNTGSVTATGQYAYVGGVVGDNYYNSSVENCYNTGSVTAQGSDASAGGVVRQNTGTITNCYYDKSVCGNIGAVSGADDASNVKGLTTAQMTGVASNDDNTMKALFDAVDDNGEKVWLDPKADGADNGKYYWYYPHLKGFNFNYDLTQKTADEIEAADWPAKVEVNVRFDDDGKYTYDGEPNIPENVYVILGDIYYPQNDTAITFYKYNGTGWEEPTAGMTGAGIYKMKYTVGDETVEKVFTVLSTDDDYIVSYQKCIDDAWTAVDEEEAVDAGEYKVVITFSDTGYAKGHTPIEKEFKITRADITITSASEVYTYDGRSHSNNTVTVTKGALAVGDELVATATGSVKNVSDTLEGNNTIAEGYKIMHGDTDATANYEITAVSGTLSVHPRNVTLTSPDKTYIYDGTDHMIEDDEITVGGDGWVSGEGVTYSKTSIKNVGTRPNEFTYTMLEGTRAENYNIDKVEGTLEVTDDGVSPEKVVQLAISDSGAVYNLGDEITYTVTVTNIYDEAKTIRLSVPEGVTLERSVFENVAPGDSVATVVRHAVTSVDIIAGKFETAVTADLAGKSFAVSRSCQSITAKNADISVTVMLSAVNGEAVAPGESVTAEVGDKLTFAGKAANNGNVTLTNVIIHDRLTGTDYAVGSLKPGEVSEEIQVLHIVTAADALAGKIVDSVEVTAEVDVGETVSSVAEVEVSVRTEYKVTYIVDGKELTKMDAIFGQSVPQPRTPQKDGYSFAWTDEIPETMPAEDVTINGTFTIIKYTATFVKEDGTELETREYDVETTSIDEPEVPAKEGYEGAWEEYELGAGNITIKPVYTPANICKLDREYHGDTFWGRLVTFVHNLIWTAFSFIGLDIFFSIKRG